MKVARIRLSYSLLLEVLRSVTNLPLECRAIGLVDSPVTRTIDFILESRDFGHVQEGMPAPLVDVKWIVLDEPNKGEMGVIEKMPKKKDSGGKKGMGGGKKGC